MNPQPITRTAIVCFLLGTILSTCSIEEEVGGGDKPGSTNSDAITFVNHTTSTKASEATLATMQGDANGFRVYATAGTNPGAWYSDVQSYAINGANHHKYSSGKWGFVPAIYWPVTAIEYPVNFYALYPSAPAGLGAVSNTFNPTVLTAPYTIEPVGAQLDLMAAKTTAGAKPSDGVHPILFHHILSILDFSVVPGVGTTPLIQSLQVVNASNTRTFNFVAEDWNGSATGNAAYTYYGTAVPGGTGGASILPTWGRITSALVENVAEQIYLPPADADKHLMLMPQTSPSWAPVSGSAPTNSSGGYICLIYRMATGVGLPPNSGIGTNREVGFPDATQHPDNLGGVAGVSGPLFVKAGFPLPTESSSSPNFAWAKGWGYWYQIGLGTAGSCNGYIVDEYYYDQYGNRTALKLIEILQEGKKLGEKLQDGEIHVTLNVAQWDDHQFNPNPPAGVQVTPRETIIPYMAVSSPSYLVADDRLTVVCRDGLGGFDPAMTWTLSAPSGGWLMLSLSPNGAGAAFSVNGVGSQNVYLVPQSNNMGTTVRSCNLTLDGGLTVAAIVRQLPFPGLDFRVLLKTPKSRLTTEATEPWRAHEPTGE